MIPRDERYPTVLSSAAGLTKSFRAQAERGSEIVMELFFSIAESVFTSHWLAPIQDPIPWNESASIEIVLKEKGLYLSLRTLEPVN
jgi:hypothetical protein